MDSAKMTIFLAGDSTVQSYSRGMAPQCGWGQLLVQYFTDREYRVYHSAGSKFTNAVTYETDRIKIDNRAMAGRSTKNFLQEGRFDDILPVMRKGDWLLLQFGHNDAYKAKPERFVTPEEFQDKLWHDFLEPAQARGVRPVLVTPIAMREFDENGQCRYAFNNYRLAMLELTKKIQVPVIDLGRLTAEFNTKIGAEKCREIYLFVESSVYPGWPDGDEDNAHLSFGGALLYAGILARALAEVPGFPKEMLHLDVSTEEKKETEFNH